MPLVCVYLRVKEFLLGVRSVQVYVIEYTIDDIDYIRGTLVEMGKAFMPWRRTGGVERRLHFTPFSAVASTEKTLAPRSRTSQTSNATATT